MKPILFVIADSVEVYESGKLVIVGIFDVIRFTKLPAILRPFGIAIKVLANKRDYGKTFNAKIILKKAGTKKYIIDLPTQLKFPKSEVSQSMGVIAVRLSPIAFDTAGIYIFELIVGSKVLSEVRIDVIKVQPTRKKKKK